MDAVMYVVVAITRCVALLPFVLGKDIVRLALYGRSTNIDVAGRQLEF